ncbi:fumarylacetoacetate hydrolase [Nitrospirillum pindoramense]|uniref:fumarylacetoacetase n=1 Tax=Nitrospirillum amazonense TaxID=28077 RepID=A0A560HJ67_9PROT|nr:fumarylacetoacetate hydrolase [Nitrospirillum amazonense]
MTPPLIDETHNPALTSWVASANGHADFPIQNLPLGVFSTLNEAPRGGVAIGDQILDLARAGRSGLLTGAALDAAIAASGPTLNPLLALGAKPRRALRRRLSQLLAGGSDERGVVESLLYPATDCTLHLPARIGGYTDFYAGIHHALNVGRQFRPDNPLLPNYKHVPIGYHGRASSVRVTGTEVRRPNGQRKAPDADAPTFGPSQRLDLELELGIWIGPGNELGSPIGIGEADSHIAGLCLLNDWSARDLQAWEYQPLGPFLAKNFLTTVSPWIVTAEALAPFRTRQPARAADDPRPLPYLWDEADQEHGAYGIELSVQIRTPRMREAGLPPHRLGTGPATNLYWTAAQLVAHHTCNGCDLNPGDLLGTGTISTPDDSGVGSLLELTRGGKAPITLPTGETRTFLADGDELILAGRAVAEGYVAIGFGDCRGQVTPAPAL